MNHIKLLIALTFIAAAAHSQTPKPTPADIPLAPVDTSWKKGGFIAITLSQVSLTNWAAGGVSEVSALGLLNLFANYAKDDVTWENYIDLGYGFSKAKDQSAQKTEDKIDLGTKYGYRAFGDFYYSGLINFRSQFGAGYNYPNDSVVISRFAAPAYLTVALGLDYRPNEFFSAFFSPITAKFTFVTEQRLADAGAFGVDPAEFNTAGVKISEGKTIRTELGAYFRAKFQKDLNPSFNLATTIALFDNYSDKNPDNRDNVDVNWETLLTLKAGKFITATLYTSLIYDHDIDIPTFEDIGGVQTVTGFGPKTQFKEVFGFGFSYKFNSP